MCIGIIRPLICIHMQALNFALEGAQQFSPGKGHFYEENVNLYLNFAKGITAKAQGTHGNCCGCRGLIRGLYVSCRPQTRDNTSNSATQAFVEGK